MGIGAWIELGGGVESGLGPGSGSGLGGLAGWRGAAPLAKGSFPRTGLPSEGRLSLAAPGRFRGALRFLVPPAMDS